MDMGGIFPHFHWGHEQDKPIVGSSTHHETLSLATEKAEQFTTPHKKNHMYEKRACNITSKLKKSIKKRLIRNETFFYANSWITSLFTSDPSVLPFTFGITAVITLPISAFDVAPTSEITCLITSIRSSSVNCSGKYALKI